MKYTLLLLALLLQLFGCASRDPYYPAPQESDTRQPSVFPPESPGKIEPAQRQPSASDSAVKELIEQAIAFHREGSYQRSVAVAERAMRLDRHEPSIYLVLAANYVALQDYSQAERLISQGLPLAEGQQQTESRFRLLLEEIRKTSHY